MNINTHTKVVAEQKICHLTQPPHQGRCCASDCMAWQWVAPEKLSYSTGLLRRYAESAFDGYRDGYAHEMPDLDPANFYQPVGEGWRFHSFEADDDGWKAMWERETDPERKGYCAALEHPMAVVTKLEEIITAIYGTEQGGCK